MDENDYGPQPFVANVEELTLANDKFRVTKWTGQNLQMTLMCIPVGGEIGLEVHETHDQFLRLEQGRAQVVMGPSQDNLYHQWEASANSAVFVPAGTWHNLKNIGEDSLKLYSIYAPPQHPHGTIHATSEEAARAESEEHQE
jgi:mannose-6-phosphate isomerase-like protein (cupin superfamily)